MAVRPAQLVVLIATWGHQHRTWWSPTTLKAIVIKFDKETCRPCPVRDPCTRSKTSGRTLSLQPRELQEVLDHARLQQGDELWRAKYGTRAGIEGTIRQAVAVTGMRRARYLGLQKTPSGARLLRRCAQPHSSRCLVERPPARPHPRQPPCPPRPLPRRMTE
nr:transposase [Streptomyces sp. N502]